MYAVWEPPEPLGELEPGHTQVGRGEEARRLAVHKDSG
jgi:hypothetical protein